MGYHRAGFDVVGVDINPQPRYPFEFVQGDALTFLAAEGHRFDAVHASPPCQDHSPLRAVAGLHGTADLLPQTREALNARGGVWVIENVMGAQMTPALVLCGGMFGLRTYRHRQFEISTDVLLIEQPHHPKHVVRTSTKKRRYCWDAGMHISVTGDVGSTIGGLALGIDWMTGNGLSQAIPPAYTEFIGEQLLAAVQSSWA